MVVGKHPMSLLELMMVVKLGLRTPTLVVNILRFMRMIIQTILGYLAVE
jgi:hypothetical protein